MKEEFLVKSEEISSYGENPGTRPVEKLLKNGIIILDKWPGPTSHDVAATVKKMLGLNKVGHGGTLDPAVSGVLPITLENACKVIPALQRLTKEYVGVMQLHKDVGEKELRAAVAKMVGKIKQKPPVRSAVARRVRERTVYSLDILEINRKEVLFNIVCEAGTYVRVVCHDIGRLVGGAHMSELRRVRSGPFDESKAVKMQDVADAFYIWKTVGNEDIRDFVLPVEKAVGHLPKIIVKDSAVYSIANGTPVYTAGISKVSVAMKEDDLAAVMTLKGELVALAVAKMASEDMVKKKGLAAKTDRVVIEKGLYPKSS